MRTRLLQIVALFERAENFCKNFFSQRDTHQTAPYSSETQTKPPLYPPKNVGRLCREGIPDRHHPLPPLNGERSFLLPKPPKPRHLRGYRVGTLKSVSFRREARIYTIRTLSQAVGMGTRELDEIDAP